MIPLLTNVKVRKIAEAAAPKFRTAVWTEYKVGVDNPFVSPPVEYEVVGKVIMAPVEAGQFIVLSRRERNGVKIDGIFRSSRIEKLTAGEKEGTWTAETQNSVYLIEVLENAGEV